MTSKTFEPHTAVFVIDYIDTHRCCENDMIATQRTHSVFVKHSMFENAFRMEHMRT